MSSLEQIIDNFIVKNKLDVNTKEPLTDLVNDCLNGLFKHLFSEQIPEISGKQKAQKVLKADRVEDPASVENLEDLRNCTTGVLNQFCKEKNLKVGGNKKELMDRVWRHIQGETSDDDKSSRNKPKAVKKPKEEHTCCGKNAKGMDCAVAGTECSNGHWFCWRHITEAEKFIGTKVEPEPEIKPVKSSSKKPKSEKKPKKSKVPEPEESEHELVTDEE
jgi:hypothetical protein